MNALHKLRIGIPGDRLPVIIALVVICLGGTSVQGQATPLGNLPAATPATTPATPATPGTKPATDSPSTKTDESAVAAVNPLDSGMIIFCGDMNNEPYSYMDMSGAAKGYDVEVARELAKELGVEIQIDLLPRERAMEAVLKGDAHAMLGLGFSRAQGVSVTQQWRLCGPTVTREYHIAILAGDYGLDANMESDVNTVLKGARVAVQSGDPISDYFEGISAVTLIEGNSPSVAGRLLLNRHVLAYVADENTIRYAAKKLHDDRFTMAGKMFYEVEKYGPAVPREANSQFAAKLNAAVGKLRQSGKLADIQKDWFSYPVNPVSLKPFILIGVAGTGLFVFVMMVMWLIKAWKTKLTETVETRTRKLNAEVEVLRKQVHDLQSRDPSYNSFSGEEPPLELGDEDEDDGTKPLVLEKLIQDITPKLQMTAGEHIKLAIQHKDEIPPVLAEPEAITKVLVNLCTNARDAIATQKKIVPETPERIWISMRVADDEEKPANMKKSKDKFVALAVRDAGCGISPDMVQKIFQKGFTTKQKAAGEGLSAVYATVAKHGGWIDVESAAGRGATISVFLPAVNM